MGLWDPDGVFEFVGSPPVVGSFHGAMAIRTLYMNRVKAGGMQLLLQGSDREQGGRAQQEAALGLVDTQVHRVREVEGKIVAGWTTVIGTRDGRGFQVSGSHSFTLREGRISHLKVVVSPKPDEARDLSLENLSVVDIGRLALAAWPVV
jgi:ketosteroid isomerase-like protein